MTLEQRAQLESDLLTLQPNTVAGMLIAFIEHTEYIIQHVKQLCDYVKEQKGIQ